MSATSCARSPAWSAAGRTPAGRPGGRAARARVEREFTWATTAGRVAALYEEALASPAAGDRRSAGDEKPATVAAPLGAFSQAGGVAPLPDAAAYAEADS